MPRDTTKARAVLAQKREARRLERLAKEQQQREEAERAGSLKLMDRRGRCRWSTYCPNLPGPGRFEGAFCATHEDAATYALGLTDDEPTGPLRWLQPSGDAMALIEDYERATEGD